MLTSQDVTDWLAFYRVRPFGFVRESVLFGTLAAQQYNIHKSKGPDKAWDDMFPVDVRKDADGKDTPEKIFELFKQYNVDRGYTPDGKKKLVS